MEIGFLKKTWWVIKYAIHLWHKRMTSNGGQKNET